MSRSCRRLWRTYATLPDHSDIYQLSLTAFFRSAILEAAAPLEHSAHIGTGVADGRTLCRTSRHSHPRIAPPR